MIGRVLLASQRSVPGGAQRSLITLAGALRGGGWGVEALLGEPGWLADELRAQGIDVRVDGSAGSPLVERRGCDVLLSVGTATHAWAGPSAARAGVPAAWWVELSIRGRPVEAAAAATPAEIVATLTRAAADAVAGLGVTAPISVVPPGVDPGAVAAHRQQVPALRARLGLEPGDELLVMVARLDSAKGQDLAIDAAADLLREGRPVHLALVGGAVVGHEGDLPDRLRRQASRAGLGDRVTFIGHVEDPGPWHAAGAIALAPSRHEAFGLSVVEALAHGVPVVASAVDGPSEVLDGGRVGVLVPPDDPVALACAVGGLLDDPQRRASLAREGPARARCFTPETVAAQWSRLLLPFAPNGCGTDG